MRKAITILVVLFWLSGCNQSESSIHHPPLPGGDDQPVIPSLVVNAADTSLQLVNGVWFWHQNFFSGTMETYFPSGTMKATQTFYEGKEEGMLTTYYENGQKDSQRFYHKGEKDSINRGWWANGSPRFEYHFKDGVYDGDFKEWYSSGKPLKYIIYKNGKEQTGKGWRENGKVYMSFVMRDGRLYGLINPNLCYSLKNERGEYVAGTSPK